MELYHKIHKVLPLVCTDAVVVDPLKKQLLLVKRKNDPEKGKWWFPGGRILKNEKYADAILRKAEQEVGIRGKIKKQLGTYEYFSKTGYFKDTTSHMISVVFLVEIDISQKIILDWQSSDSRWFTKVNPRWHPYLKKYLKQAGFKEGNEPRR